MKSNVLGGLLVGALALLPFGNPGVAQTSSDVPGTTIAPSRPVPPATPTVPVTPPPSVTQAASGTPPTSGTQPASGSQPAAPTPGSSGATVTPGAPLAQPGTVPPATPPARIELPPAAIDDMPNPVEDATITAKIKSALVSDAATRTSNIDVDTKGGIVILEGTVANDAQALRAIQLTRAIEGVRSVTNNLRLQ